MNNFTITTKDNTILTFDISKKQVLLSQRIDEYIINYIILILIIYYNSDAYYNNFNILLRFYNNKYELEYNNINQILQKINKINTSLVIDNNNLIFKHYKIMLYLYNDLYNDELHQFLQIKIEYSNISSLQDMSHTTESLISNISSLSSGESLSLSSSIPPPPPRQLKLTKSTNNGFPNITVPTLLGGKKQKLLKKFK
jgi:hypothetical protein